MMSIPARPRFAIAFGRSAFARFQSSDKARCACQPPPIQQPGRILSPFPLTDREPHLTRGKSFRCIAIHRLKSVFPLGPSFVENLQKQDATGFSHYLISYILGFGNHLDPLSIIMAMLTALLLCRFPSGPRKQAKPQSSECRRQSQGPKRRPVLFQATASAFLQHGNAFTRGSGLSLPASVFHHSLTHGLFRC
jgi:hypothetical protein